VVSPFTDPRPFSRRGDPKSTRDKLLLFGVMLGVIILTLVSLAFDLLLANPGSFADP
jgi:hypothetical protein